MFYNKNMDNIVEILCAKDETAAKKAASAFIDNYDIKDFEKLCNKMDFLFDFVRENVYKRLNSAVTKENFKNLINFFDFYSPYFDDFFASVLAKYANEDLTDEMLEILSSGNNNQKTYAAGYFIKIPDSVALEDLESLLETDFEPLFLNCASALGKMEATEIYEKYKNLLNTDDEFVKLNAVKFLVAYGDKNSVNSLITSMKQSDIPENIAGEIVSLISPLELIKTDFNNGISLFNNIINGLGEILPLENIFYYEVYDVMNLLFEKSNSSEAVLLLFNLKNKFSIITENEEYIFDLDKNTKNEIFEIKNILENNKDFWISKRTQLKEFIKEDSPYLETVLEIIKDNHFKDFTNELLSLTSSKNETVVCEVVSALKETGEISRADKSKINITNANLKALLAQMFE